MNVRAALPADAAAIAELVQRAYHPYVERIGRRPAPMDDDYQLRVRQGHVYVVADENEIAGFVVLIPQADHLLIENIAVDPDRQGEGLGCAMLSLAESRARQEGLSTLRLYTNAAMTENLAFYPRRGYEEVERRSEAGFERVFFAKSIGWEGDSSPPTPMP